MRRMVAEHPDLGEDEVVERRDLGGQDCRERVVDPEPLREDHQSDGVDADAEYADEREAGWARTASAESIGRLAADARAGHHSSKTSTVPSELSAARTGPRESYQRRASRSDPCRSARWSRARGQPSATSVAGVRAGVPALTVYSDELPRVSIRAEVEADYAIGRVDPDDVVLGWISANGRRRPAACADDELPDPSPRSAHSRPEHREPLVVVVVAVHHDFGAPAAWRRDQNGFTSGLLPCCPELDNGRCQ